MSTRQYQRRRIVSLWITTILLFQGALVHAFMMRTPPSSSSLLFRNKPSPSPRTVDMARLVTSRLSTRLLAATSSSPDKMKASEIRTELESYGISTKSFLEKKELVEALEKARAEGLKPKKEKSDRTTTSTVNGGEQTSDSSSRQDKIRAEKTKANQKKVGELKKELEAMGISTKSFFEKTEFVQAYAEAMVDGPPKQKAGRRRAAPQEEEKYDPSYRDVVMQKFDPRLLGRSPVIDVSLVR